MRAAVAEMPHVTLHARADASALVAARAGLNARADVPRLSLTAVLARVVVEALREYPRVNGRTEEGEIRLYKRVNLGVAVALEDGLTVPVLRDAQEMDVDAVGAAIVDVSDRARSGRIKLADLADATFTLSTLGAHGVEFFTPIINPPQLAILGVGAVRDEIRLQNGSPVAVPVLYLSLSFDHAAMDGVQAARFLELLVAKVEAGGPDRPAAGGS
ncbi:2-oxoacid dehydrogenase/acyltransferase catalytic subunit [Blastococcus colisei]|uniref:2-oxoacid dehydrogenase/acyltransferase catalytic subunit n=2 Tax=Blastococcus colisei TaxID=1564162 RepID=A0A543PG61_9ACTN|nr:2-oxoacid dehydrogenase/acyltransferase catalytic subunit [Blastococcus colisei]